VIKLTMSERVGTDMLSQENASDCRHIVLDGIYYPAFHVSFLPQIDNGT
jgi:hypothetical protein